MLLVKMRKGFTLVEVMIVAMLVSLLLTITYRLFGYITTHSNKGLVDLQELQGARYAINYLRRDFKSSTPVILPQATEAEKNAVTAKPLLSIKQFKRDSHVIPIIVDEQEIHFFKYIYTPPPNSSLSLEEVNYRLDSAKGCLVRLTDANEVIFSDIRGAKFELYSHPLQQEVPMLLVTLTVDVDQKEKNPTNRKSFEIVTSISSGIANKKINHPYWLSKQ